MKRQFLPFTFCFLSAVVICIGCSKDKFPSPPRDLAELNRFILAEMEKEEIPSIAACIIKEDQIVWENFYGYENIASETPPSRETIYLLASVSKTITAVAIMQLQEKGLLNLEEDVNAYLNFPVRNPRFPDIPITARMLLTHTSSLAWPTNEEDPNYNTPHPNDSAPPIFPWIKDYLTPDGAHYRSTTWRKDRPGSSYQYSNTGVALLGYLVESITGQDFAQYCKDHIFEPLEMTYSGFRLQDVDQAMLATLYHDGGVIEQYSVSHYPSSTVRSSLEELSHFLIAIMNGGRYRNQRILEESTVDEMLRIQLPVKDLAFLWQTQQADWMGHVGGYWGVSSSLDLNRKHQVGVIILANSYGKETLYPDGYIYRLLHEEAERYFVK